MSMIEIVNDKTNSFLQRREITCNFKALGGKLKQNEAVEMITKEFKLDDKTVIAINMKNQTGRPNISATFYVYDNEELARRQVNPVIFERLERKKAKDEEVKAEAPAEEVKAETPAEEVKAEAPAEEVKAEAPAEEVKAEAPAEEVKSEEK